MKNAGLFLLSLLTINLSAQDQIDFSGGQQFANRKAKLKRKEPEYIQRKNSQQSIQVAWDYVQNNHYKKALDLYSKLLQKKNLTKEEREGLDAGLGISLYHQKGCLESRPYLDKSRKTTRFREDAYYYLALCELEAKRPKSARPFFEFITKANHPSYEEPSRFYLALLDESEENNDDAKAAYMDLIDFSKDPVLIKNARARLKILEYKLATDKRLRSPWSFLGSFGMGYDSNAVLLPQSLDPSAQNLDSQKSIVETLMFYGSYRYPWTHDIDQSFNYSMLLLHNENYKASLTNDLQSHEISTEFGLDTDEIDHFGWAFSFSHVFLGELKKFNSYMATFGSQIKWKHRNVDGESKMASTWETALKFSRIKSIKAASSGSDPEGFSYALENRYSYLKVSKHSFGPELNIEYHPTLGSESSFYSYSPAAFWDIELGKESLRLKLQQELSFQHSLYYDSTKKRRDYNFSFSEAISKGWGQHWETRLQINATTNLSNLKTSYQYDRFQAMFLVSGVF